MEKISHKDQAAEFRATITIAVASRREAKESMDRLKVNKLLVQATEQTELINHIDVINS
jgi:hypothetical protein